MRKTLERLGERLLVTVVPGMDAAAGCPPDNFTRNCSPYCPAPYRKARVQNCSYTPTCQLSCGPCYYVVRNCA
ncbi:hypothetical protein ACXR2U_13085 [Jatrophihabitans sp. YIM 134969]